MNKTIIYKVTTLLMVNLLLAVTTSFALDKSSLVGAWLFDGKSGKEITDSSGNL